MSNLRLNPAIKLFGLGSSNVQLCTPSERLTIHDDGPLVAALVRHCNVKMYNEDELICLLTNDGFDRNKVVSLVMFFKNKNVLGYFDQNGDVDLIFHQFSWISSKQSSSESILHGNVKDISDFKIGIFESGVLAKNLASKLRSLGFLIEHVGDDCFENIKQYRLLVGCVDQEDHSLQRRRNEQAFEHDCPILFAQLGHQFSLKIGPIFVKNETACFECYHHRLRSNLSFYKEFDFRNEVNSELTEKRISVFHAELAAYFIASEILKYALCVECSSLYGKICEINFITYEMQLRTILKLPRCHVCGIRPPHAKPSYSLSVLY